MKHSYTQSRNLIFFLPGVGILLPFIPLYQKQLGLTKVEAGLINALMPFISSLAHPLFAVIADKVNRHRLMLLICCLLAGLLHVLLILVPSAPPVPSAYRVVDVSCLKTGSHICNNELLGILDVCHTPESSHLMYTVCVVNCSFPAISEACFQTTPMGNCVYTVTNSTALVFNISLVRQNDEAGLDTSIARQAVIHHSGKIKINGSRDHIHKPNFVNQDECTQSEYQLNNITVNYSSYLTMICKNQLQPLSCKFHCSNMKCLENSDSLKHPLAVTFWSFMCVYIIAQIFYAPCASLNDAVSYEILGDKRHRWGSQRVWGTIGFGSIAALSGPIFDNVLHEDGTTNYGISCYLFLGFMILSAMAAYGLRVPENFKCSKMMKNITILLKEPPVVAFLICVFLFGLFLSAIGAFLFWYLLELQESEYHNTHKVVCGLCLLMSAVTEIPCLFFSGKVIKKIGEVNCLYLAFIAYGIRFLSYSFLMNIWLVLPVELLHGVTFGLMFPAATMYANQIAPPGMSATLQGLVSGIHYGLGRWFYHCLNFLILQAW
jgi:MFS family permease